MRPVRNVFQKLSRTEQRREGVVAYLWEEGFGGNIYYTFFSSLDVPSSPGNLSVRNVRSRSAVLSWEPALRQVSVEWLTECKKLQDLTLISQFSSKFVKFI
jgi:hypothetical protein